ncbi:SMP-30/gluconolactonase/LRE family protein [Paenarthrobacter sp. AB444]|uniref:SMP-30/gluconolactonase/LRE family protein n=1 Tax=Paenarthrobacter sp. AB444 TaxID=3025681 RepID=UPI0023673A55|nr:SMP-30/gluconolactonase/LRE family protein [Paenarthrobacter sp. AB444]MDD7833911.1 SMP-30/gluconolactonase/LRE family protein [Paenarthrobacter sp. AB444]
MNSPLAKSRCLASAAAALLTLVLAGCSGDIAPAVSPAASDRTATQQANRVMRVTDVPKTTGMTLLEGPTFGGDGNLYVVDVTAPSGAPKVLRVDTQRKNVSTIYTDDRSVLTSAQFSPKDGRLYVTDFVSGAIRSMRADGQDVRDVFAGPVDGKPMQPDDISFDDAGNLYVTDAAGASEPYWAAKGRVIRVDGVKAEATVLADGLASPNGIGFSPDGRDLWIGLNTGNRIDHLKLTMDGKSVATAHPAIYASAGAAQVDSIAVDAAGNLYVGLHNRPAVLIYGDNGQLLKTIAVPAEDASEVSSATNVAIKPGTTEAYVTISGSGGGFLYSFEALAQGIRQSNGG